MACPTIPCPNQDSILNPLFSRCGRVNVSTAVAETASAGNHSLHHPWGSLMYERLRVDERLFLNLSLVDPRRLRNQTDRSSQKQNPSVCPSSDRSCAQDRVFLRTPARETLETCGEIGSFHPAHIGDTLQSVIRTKEKGHQSFSSSVVWGAENP
jgi:hypothetical protein